MKHLAWMSAGILALAGLASPGAAQTAKQILPASEESFPSPVVAPFSGKPCPPRLGSPSIPCPPPPTIPGAPDPKTPTTPTPPTPPTTSTPDFSGAGEFKGSTGRTTSAVSGTGIGGAVTGDPTSTSVLTPLILPGLFTATAGQSALPMDRVFFEYGYFKGVAVQGVGSSAPSLNQSVIPAILGQTTSPPYQTIVIRPSSVSTLGVSQSAAPVAGFNLNTFNVGVEKTFLDGIGSVYASVPFLYAADNISGQQINGLGDVNFGFKLILYQSLETGNTLTGGFTVSVPTGHPAIVNSYVQSGNGTGDSLVPASSISVNPTFLQPWVAGLLFFDRLYVHEYFGVVIPTDPSVATYLNSDFTVGYALFRAGESRWFSSVTPTIGLQALIPVTNRGTAADPGATTPVASTGGTLPAPAPPATFTFTDQVFVSGGVQLGLGERWLLSGNIVVPVASPRGYSVGATFSLNYFY